MNKLENLFNEHAKYWDCWNDEPLKENHTQKCAEITKNIVIKFATFINEEGLKSSNDNNNQNWEYPRKKQKFTTEELFNIFIESL